MDEQCIVIIVIIIVSIVGVIAFGGGYYYRECSLKWPPNRPKDYGAFMILKRIDDTGYDIVARAQTQATGTSLDGNHFQYQVSADGYCKLGTSDEKPFETVEMANKFYKLNHHVDIHGTANKTWYEYVEKIESVYNKKVFTL